MFLLPVQIKQPVGYFPQGLKGDRTVIDLIDASLFMDDSLDENLSLFHSQVKGFDFPDQIRIVTQNKSSMTASFAPGRIISLDTSFPGRFRWNRSEWIFPLPVSPVRMFKMLMKCDFHLINQR